MNKRRLPLLAVLLVAAAAVAAGGWYVLRPHDRLAMARSLMAKGDARGAQLELRHVVAADPANAEAHFRLGEVQLRLGDPMAAERELTLAADRGWNAQALAGPMAQTLLMEGRFEDVLKASTAGLNPSQQLDVELARVGAELALKRTGDAQHDAAEAQRLAPHSVEAALAMAQAAQAAGDAAAAGKAVDQALAIDPHAPAALLVRADLLAAQGDRAGALAATDAAVAAAPNFAPARLRRAELLMTTHDNARALPDLDRVLKADPRNVAALFLRAEILAQARDFSGADAALQTIAPVLPRIPRGDYLLGLVKGALNQPQQGLDAANRYLAAAPDDPAAYILTARLDLLANNPSDAVATLNSAVAGGHVTAETLEVLGQAEAALGQPAQAVQDLQQAAKLAPHDPGVMARLASMRLGAGDAAAAAQDFQHLVDMLPVAAAPGNEAGAGAAAKLQVSTQGPAPPALPGATLTPQQAETALIGASLQAGDFARAQAALDRLRAQGAAAGLVDAMDGLIKLARLDFPGAQAAFEAAEKNTPHATGIRLDLARTLALQGKQDAARTVLEQAVAQDPTSNPALAALVATDLQQNRPDAAVTALEAAHKANPQSVLVTAALADLYIRTKQPQKALDLLGPALTGAEAEVSGAVGSSPAATIQLMSGKVRAQLALGQRAAAIDTARQMLALQPANPNLRRDLAGLLEADGRFDQARSVLHDGLVSTPGNAALLAADVGLATRQGGVSAGLARADELMRDPANLPTAQIVKGDLYVSQKRYAEAAQAYRAGLTDQSAAGLVVRAALAAQEAGESAQATQWLRDWLAKHPDAVEAEAVLASFDLQANRLDDAKTHMQAVLAKRPNDPAILNNLAWVLEQQGDRAQALALAQKSWNISPLPQTADTLGWLMLGSNQSGPALNLLRVAASGLPNDPSVQYHYAVALKDAGQPQQAKPILTALAQRAQPFAEQQQARQLLQTLGAP